MESLARGTALLVGLGFMVCGAVLMARTKRASTKDAAHIKLLGIADIKTSSAGALLVGVGMAIFLPGLLLRSQPEPVAAPSQAESNVNLNIRGDSNVGVGTMSGGSININVQKNATAKYEQDLHKLLLSQNPTEFKITAADLSPWLEDDGRTSLNVTFANPRNIPIKSLSVEVLNPKSGASFVALRPLDLARSRIFQVLKATDVSIPANGSVRLPVAFLDEIQGKLHDVSGAYCAFDASVDTSSKNDNKDVQETTSSSPRKPFLEGGTSSRTLFSGVLLRIKTTSIFEQKLVSHAWVFVRYADKESTAELWYPNKKAMAPLRCVDSVGLQ